QAPPGMSDKRISELTSASSVSGTDVVPIVQSSSTKKSTLQTLADWIIQTAASFNPSGSGLSATTAPAAIIELDTNIDALIADSSSAHAATAISFTPAGAIAATTVQAAIEEVVTDYIAADAVVDGVIDAHIADTDGAHESSAISFTPSGSGLSATTVSAQLQ